LAPPPHDGLALLANAHTDALGCRDLFLILAMNISYTESQSYAIPLGEIVHTEMVLPVDVRHMWFRTDGEPPHPHEGKSVFLRKRVSP
jgi:hypothetical protein